jgi:hypothetical protein
MAGLDDDEDEDESDSQPGNGSSSRVPHKKLIGRSFVLSDNGVYERIIRKRKRKSSEQLKTLMREFERNPNWSKETLLEVSRKTGLSEA